MCLHHLARLNTQCIVRLDVTLHAQPAERHYDPEVVRFKVASPIWGTEWIKVRHPWQRADEHHVLPTVWLYETGLTWLLKRSLLAVN